MSLLSYIFIQVFTHGVQFALFLCYFVAKLVVFWRFFIIKQIIARRYRLQKVSKIVAFTVNNGAIIYLGD